MVRRILVTGAAGAVGGPVCRALLQRGHFVRGFDRLSAPFVSEQAQGELEDAGAVRAAMGGVDTLVHLAAQAHDEPFPDLVGPNVLGLFHVLDAARTARLRRVVLASSIQVLGRRRGASEPASTAEGDPGNHYGLTKLWAESMGAMYARRFGLSVLAIRIAWMVRDPAEAAKMDELSLPDLYLSARDCGQFFADAVEAEVAGFAVLYAASRGGERCFDMEPARRLIGYEARDRWPHGLGFEFHSGLGPAERGR